MNELRALNARFIHNFLTNDCPRTTPFFIPASSISGPRPRAGNRATYLKYLGKQPSIPKSSFYWDVRDELITIIGDVHLCAPPTSTPAAAMAMK